MKSNIIEANVLAIKANAFHKKELVSEERKRYFEIRRNYIINKIALSLAASLTILYIGIVIFDGFIMTPILSVVITSGFGMSAAWLPYGIAVYITIALIAAFFISSGIIKNWSIRALELEEDFSLLASPEKPYSQIKREVGIEAKREYIRSIIFSVIFLSVVLGFALTRNYFNPSHQFKVRLVSITDWISVIFPVVTAFLMILASIYKEIILKFTWYSIHINKHTNAAYKYSLKAQQLTQDAVQYVHEAKSAGETIDKSKELLDAIDRYNNRSSLNFQQPPVIFKVQKGGLPAANCQIQGITSKEKHLYSVTNELGIAHLGLDVDDFLKKILIDRFLLVGTRFDIGQLIIVELDSLEDTSNIRGLLG